MKGKTGVTNGCCGYGADGKKKITIYQVSERLNMFHC